MNVDPEHVHQAAESAKVLAPATGTWLAGILAAVGGFFFRDLNQRTKALEGISRDMATKNDIRDIYIKMEALNKASTDRIIQLYKDKG